MKFSYSNILGQHTIDSTGKVSSQAKKDAKIKPANEAQQKIARQAMHDKQFYLKFQQENLKLTREAIKKSVSNDNLIIQTISNIEEIDRSVNMLSKRLREWYSLYLPELIEAIEDHKVLSELVSTKTRAALLKEIKSKQSMGADLAKKDVTQIQLLAKQIEQMFTLRESHLTYLESIMKQYCPNIVELCGATIAAKLLEHAKSLKRLALLPASTIQLLGAEKALFRHLRTGARSPKHGLILEHQLLQRAKRKDRGKAARMLADKISLCARLDYFKGEFKAPEYKKELEEKLL